MNSETIKWLADRDIQWLPVLLRVEQTADKVTKHFLIDDMKMILGYTPRTNFFLHGDPLPLMKSFLDNIDEMLNYATEYNASWVLALNTHDVFVVDVDDANALPFVEEWVKNTPYYLSTTKKLLKLFVMDTGMLAGITTTDPDVCFFANDNLKLFEERIEIQKGLWSYMPLDACIHNADKDVANVNVPEWIESYLPFSTKRKTRALPFLSKGKSSLTDNSAYHAFKDQKLWKLIGLLDYNRAVDWKPWFDVACALKSSKDPNAYEMWVRFSQLSPFFCEERFHDGGCDKLLWDRIVPRRTVGSLHFWAKNDNPDRYDKVFGTSYEAVKERWEVVLFKLNSPPRFVIMQDDQGSRYEVLTRTDLKTRLEDVFFSVEGNKNDEKKYKLFFNQWIADPTKRVYNRIIFDPSPNASPLNYNTYQGPPVVDLGDTRYDEECVDTVKWYILDRLCGGDRDFADFFFLWLAWIVQKPWEMTRVCIVIKSKEGVGKNLFLQFFGKIVGYYKEIVQLDTVLGKFNALLQDVILLNLNEVSIKDTYDKKGVLNQLITDPEITIEKKGVDAVVIKNHLNIIGTTNFNNPFPISYSDRRFACVETMCAPLTADEASFYAHLFAQNETQYSFYNWLSSLTLPTSLSHIRPHTSFYNECRIMNASPHICFWLHLLNNLQRPLPKKRFFSYQYLYDEYKAWRSYYHASNDQPEKYRSFTHTIRKFPFMTPKRDRTGGSDKEGLSVEPELLLEHLKDYNTHSGEQLPDAMPDELMRGGGLL